MSCPSRSAVLAFLICCSFLLPAAPAAAIDVCGNGICATDAVPPENAANCPVDCAGGTDCVIDTCDNGACSEPTTWIDSDYDGVPDPFEYELAHKFFPTTLLQWHDEDRSESYLFRSRSTPYTLRPYYDETECVGDLACIEIRYGITFFYDHGDTAADLYEHVGDSKKFEWECYSDRPLEAQATVFSAESKHALYHTDDECDGGGFWNSDDCPNNQYDMREWKEGRLQNVGNPGYAAFDTTIQDPSGCGLYEVWGGEKFGEASPYLQHFLKVINWAL